MLPIPKDFGKKTSPARKFGRVVRMILELFFCLKICRSGREVKGKRIQINLKFEIFKSIISWCLLIFLVYFVFGKRTSLKEETLTADDDIENLKIFVEGDGLSEDPEETDIQFIKVPTKSTSKDDRDDRDMNKEERSNQFNENNKKKKEEEEETLYSQQNHEDDEYDEDYVELMLEDLEKQQILLEERLTYYKSIKTNRIRSEAVKEAFRFAYEGYIKHAVRHDEISPLTNETNDSYGGFGATLVDSIDTMCLMGLYNLIPAASSLVENINFNKDVSVSFFETTIRFLGGLLAGYECTNDDVYLNKAIELAERMKPAFDSPSGYPYHQINLKTGEKANARWTGSKSILSEVGSIQLEWMALSMYSKNPEYNELAQKALKRIYENERKVKGLFPIFLDINTGNFSNNGESKITMGGLGDSFYEYLFKQYLLSGEKKYLKWFDESKEAVEKYLVKKTNNGMVYLSNLNEDENTFEHLQCFYSGVLSMYVIEFPSKYSSSATLDLSKDLLNTCIDLYTRTKTGLAPDVVTFSSTGYKIADPKYILRPETVESIFYMYRATFDEIYRDIAWSIFQSIEKYCKTNVAYASLRDVQNGDKMNSMQSFFLAETLKYLYLIFADENVIDLNSFVFSTEGHIFKRHF